jgi:hypothetical protein
MSEVSVGSLYVMWIYSHINRIQAIIYVGEGLHFRL